MKRIFVIALCLLMLPVTAFSMTSMTDSEMDSITGQAGLSTVKDELNMDQTMDNINDGRLDSQTGETIVAELNTDPASKNSIHGHGRSKTCGVSIWVFNVNFDIYIACIAYGDTDSSFH